MSGNNTLGYRTRGNASPQGRPRVYLCGHSVEHARIDHAAQAYALYLLFGFDELGRRHYGSACLSRHHALLKVRGLCAFGHVPKFFLSSAHIYILAFLLDQVLT